jgi:hypothetical protein
MTGNAIEGKEAGLLLGGSDGESVQQARRQMWVKIVVIHRADGRSRSRKGLV